MMKTKIKEVLLKILNNEAYLALAIVAQVLVFLTVMEFFAECLR